MNPPSKALHYPSGRIDNQPCDSSSDEIRWDEKAGLRRDAIRSQVIDALEAQRQRRPAMKKISTAEGKQARNFEDRQLTIGLDLGDRSSWYCVLDETGEVLLEQKLRTTPNAMKEVFGKMPRSTSSDAGSISALFFETDSGMLEPPIISLSKASATV